MPILDARLLDSDPEGAELLRVILTTKRGRKADDGISIDADLSTTTDGFPKVSRKADVPKADGYTKPRDIPLQAANGADL
jgi:hypothetical protein